MLNNPRSTIRDAAFAESFDRKMIRQGRYKLIVENDPLVTELYDIQQDPGETTNLARDPSTPRAATSDPQRLAAMNGLLRRVIQWQQECEGVNSPIEP